MVRQELLWPHYLAWLGTAVALAATVVMWLWGVSQVLTVVSLGACGLGGPLHRWQSTLPRRRRYQSPLQALSVTTNPSRPRQRWTGDESHGTASRRLAP